MEPKLEPKQHTPEEIAELEKSRTISDAELLKDGAEYVVGEGGEKRLNATGDQREVIQETASLTEGQQIQMEKIKETPSTLFEELFKNFPVGSTVARHWESANVLDLESVAQKIKMHSANPWVFSADPRHFWQFANKVDIAVLETLTREEHEALLGEWEDEGWDPASFGYKHP